MKHLYTLLFLLLTVTSINAALLPSKPEEHNYSNLEVEDSYASDGIIWLTASDDDTQFVMTLINGSRIPGSYGMRDCTITFYRNKAGGEQEMIKATAIQKAETTLNPADNTPVVVADFTGDDKKRYSITAHFTAPEVKEIIDLNLEGVKLKDIIDKSSMFQIIGETPDGSMGISIVPIAKQVAGHYTLQDLKAYSNYNYIIFNKEDGKQVSHSFYDADFDVAVDESGKTATVTGTFYAGKYQVNANLQCNIEIAGLTWDTDEDIEASFSTDDVKEITHYDDYTAVYVVLENKDRKENFSLYVYVPEYDSTIDIPVGSYPIDKTYKAPSVQAGMVYQNSVYPTFYAKLDDDYNLSQTMWYAMNGTLTVANNNGELSFEVNAKNSYKRNMHITYNMTSSAIAPVRSDSSRTTKRIEDKQIVICKNGRKYSTMGVEIK